MIHNCSLRYVLSYPRYRSGHFKTILCTFSSSTDTAPSLISITTHSHLIPDIPLEDVRNFCFIAHIDHGKSSLASRVLQFVGNVGTAQQVKAQRSASSSLDPSTNNNYNNSSLEEIIIQTQEEDHCPNNNNAKSDKEQYQLLDTLSVEKERGITVKASAASFLYPHASAVGPHGVLLYNMVDTPGHVDFGTEVTRTLSSVQGAVLLFDAAQGVQAQSLSVYEKAKRLQVPTILPALTKVDLATARIIDVTLSVSDLFGFDPDSILHTSARSRIGISNILDEVGKQVPPPKPMKDDDGITLRARVVDSWFEPLRGVICLVQILSGQLQEGDRVCFIDSAKNKVESQTQHQQQQSQQPPQPQPSSESITEESARVDAPRLGRNVHVSKDHYSIQDAGLVIPHRVRTKRLSRGQMGYVVVGIRDPRQAKPGTILVQHTQLNQVANLDLPIFNSMSALSNSVLFASVHPSDGDGFDELSAAVDKLALNDSGLEIHKTSGSSSSDGGPYLGPGLRVGFQGLLHMEVFQQRLRDEFGMEALVTQPKVPYIIQHLASKGQKPDPVGESEVIEDLAKWPPIGSRFKIMEPVVNVRIMAPMEYAGNVMELIKRKRGTDMTTKPVDDLTWLFSARMPWGEIVTDFHDELKNISAGYASFDSFDADPPYETADLVKVDILLNGDSVGPLSFVCHKSSANTQGRDVCKKLQDVLPRQQFVTVIQAKAEGKVLASERIKAYRKDVLTKGGKVVGGGDVTRKKKLLEKQKEGKKRMKQTGKVTLSQEAFNAVITRS